MLKKMLRGFLILLVGGFTQTAFANDNLADAMEITSLPFTHELTKAEAYLTTVEADEIMQYPGDIHSWWYKYEPTENETIIVEAGDDTDDSLSCDIRLGIYIGTTHPLTTVSLTDADDGWLLDGEKEEILLTAGVQYYIQMAEPSRIDDGAICKIKVTKKEPTQLPDARVGVEYNQTISCILDSHMAPDWLDLLFVNEPTAVPTTSLLGTPSAKDASPALFDVVCLEDQNSAGQDLAGQDLAGQDSADQDHSYIMQYSITIKAAAVATPTPTLTPTPTPTPEPKHEVEIDGIKTVVTSPLTTVKIETLDDDTIRTTAGKIDMGTGYYLEAVAETTPNGETRTSFVLVNETDATDRTIVGDTYTKDTPFGIGAIVVIEEIDGMLYITIESKLNGQKLIVE